MSQARCPKLECCGSTFELQPLPSRKESSHQYAIVCSICGAVVAVRRFAALGGPLHRFVAALRLLSA